MRSLDERYLRQANEALVMAERTIGEDRSAWLRVAEGWLSLINDRIGQPNKSSTT
jgi:hypothetical protein